jgi:FkbM family methyltransferase
MQIIIKKIAKELRSAYKYGFPEYLEIKRISNIGRYKLFSTEILKNRIDCYDSKSFIGQYTEIFKREIYNFKTHDNEPYIIDCGANVGLATIYFKLKFPNAKIIAFEPDPLVFKLLCKNVDNFKLNKIELINKGVSYKNGKAKFIGNGDDAGRIASDGELDNFIEIKVVSLKRYLGKKVHLLKIDIEGAEYEVINDISELLLDVDRIFIEYHSSINRTQRLDSILKILKNKGFRYYIESTSINSPNPFIDITKRQNLDNLLNIYGYRPNEQNC